MPTLGTGALLADREIPDLPPASAKISFAMVQRYPADDTPRAHRAVVAAGTCPSRLVWCSERALDERRAAIAQVAHSAGLAFVQLRQATRFAEWARRLPLGGGSASGRV